MKFAAFVALASILVVDAVKEEVGQQQRNLRGNVLTDFTADGVPAPAAAKNRKLSSSSSSSSDDYTSNDPISPDDIIDAWGFDISSSSSSSSSSSTSSDD